ncbi:hypothetical protein Droror1_Dr00009792 [Drosera rotundifolia]
MEELKQNIPRSDEEELQKIRAMRAFVEEQDPSTKEVDDLAIRRFLRARDLDVKKASAMFLRYLSWRESSIPRNRGINPSDIRNQLAQDKLFVQGFDKQGHLIVVGMGAQHIPTKGTAGAEELERYMIYSMEKLCAMMPKGIEKLTVISDMAGWSFSNFDIKSVHIGVPLMQNYYPERIHKVFVIHVPFVFMAAWKIAQPFIDDKTKSKIFFVDDKKLKSTLRAVIDENQLPTIYGGKLPLVSIRDC